VEVVTSIYQHTTEESFEHSHSCSNIQTPPRRNLKAEAALARHIAIINRTKINTGFVYNTEQI
jgi:hypothetical protein